MNKYILILLFIASQSVIATNIINTGTQFGTEANYVSTPYIDFIGNELTLYKSKTKNLYFYEPVFYVSPDEMKFSFTKKCNCNIDNLDSNAIKTLNKREITISFPIYFYSRILEKEIVTSLKDLQTNKSKITENNVNITPFNLLIVNANIGEEVIPVYSNPKLKSIDNSYPIATKNTIAKIATAKITLEFSKLLKFIKNPNFSGEIFYKNIGTTKYTANASIQNFIKSESFAKLFADSNERKKKIVKSKSNGGGWGINLLGFKIGKTKGNSSVETTDVHKRWISKNLINDSINDYFSSTSFNSYCGKSSTECISVQKRMFNQLLPLLISENKKITASFQHVQGHKYQLINAVTSKALGSTISVNNTISNNPNNIFDATDATEIETGKEKIKNTAKLKITNSDKIKWVQNNNNKWVPTKVDLYLVDKAKLENEANIQIIQEIKHNEIMQRIELKKINIITTLESEEFEELENQKDYKKIFSYLRAWAQIGNTKSQYDVGIFYLLGKGVKMNENGAIYWFEKAANKGHIGAMSAVGQFYYDKEDYKNEMKWKLLAAQKNDKQAQLHVGMMYFESDVRNFQNPQNFNRKDELKNALYWIKKSVDNFYKPAYSQLAYIYKELNKNQKALDWFFKALQQSNTTDEKDEYNLEMGIALLKLGKINKNSEHRICSSNKYNKYKLIAMQVGRNYFYCDRQSGPSYEDNNNNGYDNYYYVN